MLVVRHPREREAEHAYAIDFVLGERLGLELERVSEPRADVEIGLAGDAAPRRVVVAGSFLRMPEARWLAPESVPEADAGTWQLDGDLGEASVVSAGLPVIFGSPGVRVWDDRVELDVDVFGAVFFLLSRYEERARPERDARERFPASASLAARAGFLDRPLADEYVEVLWSALHRVWPGLRRRSPAGGMRLSCDVDWPVYGRQGLGRTAGRALLDVVRRGDPSLAAARMRAWRANHGGDLARDPWHSFDHIMDAAERRGLSCAFYVMAGCTNPALDGGYSLDEPWLRDLLRRIHGRGHEIGLHPSYETFRDADATREEAVRLRSVCAQEGIEQAQWGGRQHFLRWENPTTWRNWETAGLDYDSTLGFPERPGFRSGTCFEHPAFDLLARRTLALRERPLVVMEQTVIGEGFDARVALETMGELRRRCRVVGGDFTLLWHNSQLVTPRLRRLFGEALDLA
ncbi:MAG: polysaccharide deacetylase family protein [Actinomycetota bacterium]|nr:polysaccharide deacetylase family protein [Actinomycetota bacterium]